jgi:hypothetical protein
MQIFILVIFVITSFNAFAVEKSQHYCSKYKVYSKEDRSRAKEHFVGVVFKTGLVAKTGQGYTPTNMQRCFATNSNWKQTREVKRIMGGGTRNITLTSRCECVAYDHIDMDELSDLVAQKIATKIQEDNSKTIEETVNNTYELHHSLVTKLGNFIDDVLSLENN